MKKNIKLSTLAYRAAALLRKRGWCQYNFINRKRQICANEAIRIVSSPYYGLEFVSLVSALKSTVNCYDTMSWNDHPKRTKEEVIDAFVRTAQRLKKMGL